MRIALRPSGGRGDYELAGSYNGLHASDLLEKSFRYQITPVITIEGKAKTHRLNGKPRIRPESDGLHPYVLISSILLLPPPRRELIKTPTNSLLQLESQKYILYGIDVDLVDANSSSVVFAPTHLWAKNQSGVLNIDFAGRMSLIIKLWNAATSHNSDLASLLLNHMDAVSASDHLAIHKVAKELQKRFSTDRDIVPLISQELDLSKILHDVATGISEDLSGYDTEDNFTQPEASKLARIKKWRRQADRGLGAREFSLAVREAYDYRCLFSGERFPKLEIFDSAGVDGAHILPWSTHQINSTANGICLCKQCHWAFDNGLFRLDFNSEENLYLLSIPTKIEHEATNSKFDLDFFRKNVGVIDKSRLPKNNSLWPSPANISEFNSIIAYP